MLLRRVASMLRLLLLCHLVDAGLARHILLVAAVPVDEGQVGIIFHGGVCTMVNKYAGYSFRVAHRHNGTI